MIKAEKTNMSGAAPKKTEEASGPPPQTMELTTVGEILRREKAKPCPHTPRHSCQQLIQRWAQSTCPHYVRHGYCPGTGGQQAEPPGAPTDPEPS